MTRKEERMYFLFLLFIALGKKRSRHAAIVCQVLPGLLELSLLQNNDNRCCNVKGPSTLNDRGNGEGDLAFPSTS